MSCFHSQPAWVAWRSCFIHTFIIIYALSKQITAPLIDQMLQQSPSCPLTTYEGMYHEAGSSRHNDLITFVRSFTEHLSPSLRHSFEAASEHGASYWLTTLPIVEHGFAMPKGELHSTICLRFGWQLARLPLPFVCGKSFNVEHAFSCPCGGFPTICHNEIRKLTANLLSEVCLDVVLSLLFNLLIMNLCSMHQLIGKMVLDSM